MSTESAQKTRVYRGRNVSELIPKIQAELGPEAIVTGRRSGLEGGVAGFFQRPFVEIEARHGEPGVDIQDGDEALPPPPPVAARVLSLADFSELPPEDPQTAIAADSPADAGFADALAAASAEESLLSDVAAADDGLAGSAPISNGLPPANGSIAPAAASNGASANGIVANGTIANGNANGAGNNGAGAPTPRAQEKTSSRAHSALMKELQEQGFDAEFAHLLLETASAHVLPFAPRIGLRRAVRMALERELPQALPLAPTGAAVAFVGPGGAGKSACVAALAETYGRHGTSSVACATLSAEADGSLRASMPPHVTEPVSARSKQALSALTLARANGIALIDAPALSPADGAAIKVLARYLAQIAPERVVVTLPATLSASAAARLLRALAPLAPNAIAITHADESEQLGVALQAACAFGLAPEYLLSAPRSPRALTRVSPSTLAEGLLP